MTSLYRRATPAQGAILRIIEGATKNAADAHPEIKVSARHRRSIAKRAAGTLSAQWPEVLAANRRSGEPEAKGQAVRKAGEGTTRPTSLRARITLSMRHVAGGHFNTTTSEAGTLYGAERAPPLLVLAHRCLRASAKHLKDDPELMVPVQTILRVLGRREKRAKK